MIIKSFVAENASIALKQVRAEMGGEAMVLKTRQVTNAEGVLRVEITACLESASAFQTSKILTEDIPETTSQKDEVSRWEPEPEYDQISPNRFDTPSQHETPAIQNRLDDLGHKLDRLFTNDLTATDQGLPIVFDAIRNNLKDADLSNNFIASVIGAASVNKKASTDPVTTIRQIMVERLAGLMEPNLSFELGDRVAFVGPAGSGKSTLLGKLAARLTVMEKKKVTMVTLDTCKMAATDEIRRYAEVLNADLTNPSMLEERSESQEDAILLIDTPALSSSQDSVARLADSLDIINPTIRVAVFSTLMRSSDALAIADTMQPLKPTHLAVTMTDLTDRLGTVISVAEHTGWSITMIGDTPGGIGHLRQPDPDLFARQILKMEVADA